jgi:mono/diheme cytochrome c family protein
MLSKRNVRAIFTMLAVFGTIAVALPAQTKVKKTAITNTPASKGGVMFDTYCASCHGPDGKGNGPAAAAFKKPVPDLTVLAKQNNGEFPADRVLLTLGRVSSVSAHGSAEMPVWGNLFRTAGQKEGEVQLRIYNLTHFLEILQVPAAKTPKPVKVELLENLSQIPAGSGEAMYQTLCAGCHGASGRGDGPASPLLRGERLDLTRLTRQNNGKFPDARIGYILGNQTGVAGHGSKEMPVWGDSFRGVGEDSNVARLRISNLIGYLKSLQLE